MKEFLQRLFRRMGTANSTGQSSCKSVLTLGSCSSCVFTCSIFYVWGIRESPPGTPQTLHLGSIKVTHTLRANFLDIEPIVFDCIFISFLFYLGVTPNIKLILPIKNQKPPIPHDYTPGSGSMWGKKGHQVSVQVTHSRRAPIMYLIIISTIHLACTDSIHTPIPFRVLFIH